MGVRPHLVGNLALLQAVLRNRPDHARAQTVLRQALAQQPRGSTFRPTPATAVANDKGLAYRQEAPAIWCPECRTAIAQAELNDLERESGCSALLRWLVGRTQ